MNYDHLKYVGDLSLVQVIETAAFKTHGVQSQMKLCLNS